MPELPPVAKGMARSFYECRRCHHAFYHDYQPFSLSNPILALPCGHGVGQPFINSVRDITEAGANTI